MDRSLVLRIGLCVLSGIGVGALQQNDLIFDFATGEIWYYLAAGLVFAAGVLFPYLPGSPKIAARGLALVLASTASYYSAVWLALSGPFGEDVIGFTIASVVGAAIVLAALVSVTSVRPSREILIAGLIAGLIGGPITFNTLPTEGLIVWLGHTAWHLLICLTIWYGTREKTGVIE